MMLGVVFALQERLFALPLEAVARVVRAVDITLVPQAPPAVPGVIDVHGEIVQVVDLCACFDLPRRALDPQACFLLAHRGRRCVALWVDRVSGVASWEDDEFASAAPLLPGSRRLRGIARCADGLVIVHDLDALLARRAAPPRTARYVARRGD